MDPLSQLDVQNPDHVTVIQRDGRITISVVKEGSTVTLGFLSGMASPLPPAERPDPQAMAVKDQGLFADWQQPKAVVVTDIKPRPKPVGAPGSKHFRYAGPTKLNAKDVREIKEMLADEELMGKYQSKTRAYEAIGRAYNVTGCAISNIARGIAWREVRI